MKKLALLLTLATPVFAAEPALTIYNQEFGVVRDTLPIDLKAGLNPRSRPPRVAPIEQIAVILRGVSSLAKAAGETHCRAKSARQRVDGAFAFLPHRFGRHGEAQLGRRAAAQPGKTIVTQ